MEVQLKNLEIYNEVAKSPISEKIDWDFLYERFLKIKSKILGESYLLSLNILNPKNAQKLNKKIRKKTYTPNTLSFTYSKSTGEIILCPEKIKEEKENIIFMFIHSCLHLKGLDHGKEMEILEEKLTRQFVI